MTKAELFLELAKPNKEGFSRWVSVTEFKDNYGKLKFGNGGDWCRKNSKLDKTFIIIKDKNITKGNSIDRIKLEGYKSEPETFNQYIKKEIKDKYKDKNCVFLGIKSKSQSLQIEIDHKEGRKSNLNTENNFQPVSKVFNNIKREKCKICKQTGKRWDAKNLKGNLFSFYLGDENYDNKIGCKGCYLFDPVEYRNEVYRKIIDLTAELGKEEVLKLFNL